VGEGKVVPDPSGVENLDHFKSQYVFQIVYVPPSRWLFTIFPLFIGTSPEKIPNNNQRGKNNKHDKIGCLTKIYRASWSRYSRLLLCERIMGGHHPKGNENEYGYKVWCEFFHRVKVSNKKGMLLATNEQTTSHSYLIHIEKWP